MRKELVSSGQSSFVAASLIFKYEEGISSASKPSSSSPPMPSSTIFRKLRMDETQPHLIGLITVLSAMFSRTDTTNANITVTPSATTVAVINDSTFFNCSTTSEQVEWFFESTIIYSFDKFLLDYKDRLRVEKYANNTRHQTNLVMQSVERNDAGLYICLDPRSKNDDGEEVQLTVLETEPVCKSNLNVSELIGHNSCAIKPDIVQLSCSVRYSGNQFPELQWIKSDENIVISSSACSDSGNIYTCNLTVESQLQMEGSSYVCQTTQSRTSNYNCTPGIFRVIYALCEHEELIRSVNDTVDCSLNSNSQSCTYSWKFDNGIINETESYDPVIELKRPGRFICEAICQIREINCTFAAMTVNVNINTVLRSVFGDHAELNRTVNDKANCSLNSSSQACTLSWIFHNDTTKWTTSQETFIEFKRSGLFICQAICEMWNNNYTLPVLTVYVTANAGSQDVDESNNEEITGRPIVWGSVVGVAFVGICVCPIVLYMYRWNKRRRNFPNGPDPRNKSQADTSNRQDQSEMVNLLRPENAGGALHEPNSAPPKQSSSEVKHVAEAIGEQNQPQGDQIPRTIKSKTAENSTKRVRGLTTLNCKLFVAFDLSDIIETFPIDICGSYGSWKVDDLWDPGAIAACARNNCLYIIDQQRGNLRKFIRRVRPDGTALINWQTGEGERGRLSVNSEGNVVMTIYDKHMLKIYSPDGILLTEQTIDLSRTSVTYIYHAVNLADKNFILCHGMRDPKSLLHRVCKIDRNGNILRSFGSEKGSDDEHLSSPVYLAERKDGTILVADQGNHRILLLSPELNFETVLFTKENDNVSLPEAMCVYEKTKSASLFVGCNDARLTGGYILVLLLGSTEDHSNNRK